MMLNLVIISTTMAIFVVYSEAKAESIHGSAWSQHLAAQVTKAYVTQVTM